MLTGGTEKLAIPHEPGEWVEVRYLSWRETNRIKREAADDEDMAARCLYASVVSWSYERPVSEETIDLLDDVTASFIIHAMIPGQRTEEERKNGSLPSTSRSKDTVKPISAGGSRAS